jgi:hypothetical protein
MFTFLPPAIIALLLAPSAYSFRPEDRECNTNLCLQSLKWCDYGSDNQNNCYYPDNVYSQADYAGSFPGLVWNHEYEIKWTKRDQETPVTIRWGFVREDGQGRPKLGADWEYSEYTSRLSRHKRYGLNE